RTSASRIFSNNIGSTLVISYGLQVAIGRVVFPGGEELEGKGVLPDQSCIPTALDLIEHRDVCLTTAVELARARAAVKHQLLVLNIRLLLSSGGLGTNCSWGKLWGSSDWWRI